MDGPRLEPAEHDVVVLGTGAAGLVAAIAATDHGASVGVYEKADLMGGTTAMSGGIVWMPNNHLQAEHGIEDSRRGALDYLESLSLGQIDSDMAAMFVDEGPTAIRHLDERTPCAFHLLPEYPDYHPEHPGGLGAGGRSIDNGLFGFDSLGEWAAKVRNHRGAQPVMLIETPLGGATSMPPAEVLGERVQRRENGMGLGLVGALLRGLLDRGVEPVLGARATRLLLEGERVVGAVMVDAEGAEAEVRARRGVVIATGGFEWNPELVRAFLRGPMTAPAGSPDNTGDGLDMAMAVGARLGNMRNAWWVPVIRTPGHEYFGRPAVHLVLLERTRPRSIMVNDRGERFTNEAGNYNAMGGVLHAFDPASFNYPNNPCWLVFDHGHKQRYDVAGCPPGDEFPDWMLTGATVEELATAMGVPPQALAATVARFNQLVTGGHDDDFGRGDSAYDTFNGDRSLPGIEATLGPLDQGPFHAVRMELGALGTNGGPKTDTRCRVLSIDGGVIPGLYAVGNAMAAPTGMVYGGAGGTLGPAITTGFVAGRDAASAV
ncbi:MAG: FAD-dependent oxidoreductase [Actinomycetota bacterium]